MRRRWDADPIVEVPGGGPPDAPYLASGWSDGVGRYAWGHTVDDARERWLRWWGRGRMTSAESGESE